MGDHCFFAGFTALTKLIISHTILKCALLCELECVCDERGREIIEAGKEQLCNGVGGGGRESPMCGAPSSVSG